MASDVVTITFTATPDPAFTYASNSFCQHHASVAPVANTNGGGFVSTPGLDIDGITGIINPGSSDPGTYVIMHAFDGACPTDATSSITINASPDAMWSAPTSLCSNTDPILLNTLITGDAGGTWSGVGVTGNAFHPSNLQGSIELTHTISWGTCESTHTAHVTVTPTPVANAGPDAAVCGYTHTQAAQLFSGQGSWTIPGGLSASSLTAPDAAITGYASGDHLLTWTVTNGGCSDSDTMRLILHDPADALIIDAGPDQILEVVTSTELHAQASHGGLVIWTSLNGNGYIATPSSSSTLVHGLSLGTNTFVARVSLGECQGASDTVHVVVEDLFIPQGFSPNGDGDNDRFEVTGIAAYPGSELTVFNRWGQKVYETNSYDNEWDGRSAAGRELPNDTYFYVLNLSEGRAYNGFVVIKR